MKKPPTSQPLNLSSISYHISPQYKASLACYFHVFKYEKSTNIFVHCLEEYVCACLFTFNIAYKGGQFNILVFGSVNGCLWVQAFTWKNWRVWISSMHQKSMQRGTILKMFRIKIDNQRLSNRVLVIFSMWSTKPPPHDDERSPTLSIDISKAKKVPSIPEGQSFELSTSIGIHLSLLVIWAMLSTITTKK